MDNIKLDLWAYSHGVILDFSRPGKPTDNAYIESFNSRFRQECLNQHWFLSLEDAKLKTEAWRRDYNSHRPHSALNNMTPEEYAAFKKISFQKRGCKKSDFLISPGPTNGARPNHVHTTLKLDSLYGGRSNRLPNQHKEFER